jgi:hypothetical protein
VTLRVVAADKPDPQHRSRCLSRPDEGPAARGRRRPPRPLSRFELLLRSAMTAVTLAKFVPRDLPPVAEASNSERDSFPALSSNRGDRI